MVSVLQLANLTDNANLDELRLALTSKRLDLLITGSDSSDEEFAVVDGLKHRIEIGRANITDCVIGDLRVSRAERSSESRSRAAKNVPESFKQSDE